MRISNSYSDSYSSTWRNMRRHPSSLPYFSLGFVLIVSLVIRTRSFLSLLASRDHLEARTLHRAGIAGRLLIAGLLSHLIPATCRARLRVHRRALSRLLLYDASVGQLLAANEFFSKVASIHRLRIGVNSVRDDLSHKWESYERIGKGIDY